MSAKQGDCPAKACEGFYSLSPRYFISNDQTCNLLFKLWDNNSHSIKHILILLLCLLSVFTVLAQQ